MIVDIAVVVMAAAVLLFVALVVPVLTRLRDAAEEAERTLHLVNEELPIVLPEVTRTVRGLNIATDDLRQTASTVRPLGEAAGAVGHTIQQAHATLHGGATAVATSGHAWLAGIRAVYRVLQQGSHHSTAVERSNSETAIRRPGHP